MQQLVASLLIASLLGVGLAVPRISSAVELPECSTVADPTTTPCVGPRGPVGPTEPTGPQEPKGTGELPACSTVADPATNSCVGPTGPTGPQDQTGPQCPTGPEGEGCTPTGYASDSSLSASNENTGPNSDNSASASSSNSADVNLDNNATIDNTIDANLTTGGNSVLYNTNAGDLSSGNIQLTVDLLNFINSTAAVQGGTLTMADIPTDYHGNIDLTQLDPAVINAILAYYVGSIFDILAGNSNTGPNSSNTADASATNDLTLDADQNAAVNNDLNIVANTGNNTASYNTQVGDLSTGNIDIALNLINIINSILSVPVLDIAMLNIFGSLFGDIYLDPALLGGSNGSVSPQVTARNETTGPHSSNDASGSSSNSLDVSTANNAAIGNNVNIGANTGGNTVGSNTLAGNVETGDVNINMAIADLINQISGDSWFLVFVNVLGQWTGQILGINGSSGAVVVLSGPSLTATNDTTGPYSTNDASASSQNSADITATSDAAINNNLNLDLNTGDNTVSYNTQAGNLRTGDINVVGNIVNIINQAIHLNQRLFLGFINIMGDWMGNLRPRPEPPSGLGGNNGAAENSDSGGSVVTAPATPSIPTTASSVSDASTVSGASTRRASRLASDSSGQIASGESVVFASADAAPEFVMPAAPVSTPRVISPWQIVSLVLVTIGAVLLVGDAIIRRRRTGTFL